MTCPHYLHGNCRVATLLARDAGSVPVNASRCDLCSRIASPRGPNSVTCKLAQEARDRLGLPQLPDLAKCLRFRPDGPGTELEAIITGYRKWLSWLGLAWSLYLDAETCGCGSLKNSMNLHGTQACIEQRLGIRDRIVKNYIKAKPRMVIVRPLLRWVALRWIDRAIRNWQAKEASKGCGVSS